MTPKTYPNSPKPAAKERKARKGSTDTARLFIHVDEMMRRPQTVPLSRYVE